MIVGAKAGTKGLPIVDIAEVTRRFYSAQTWHLISILVSGMCSCRERARDALFGYWNLQSWQKKPDSWQWVTYAIHRPAEVATIAQVSDGMTWNTIQISLLFAVWPLKNLRSSSNSNIPWAGHGVNLARKGILKEMEKMAITIICFAPIFTLLCTVGHAGNLIHPPVEYAPSMSLAYNTDDLLPLICILLMTCC